LASFVAFLALVEVYRAYQEYRARGSAWKIARFGCLAVFFAFLAAHQLWTEEPVVQFVASRF